MTARSAKQPVTRVKKGLPTPTSARAVAQRLESLQRAGVTHIPKSRNQKTDGCATETKALPSGKTTATYPLKDGESLQLLSREVAVCTKCAELAETRTQTVFVVGNPDARLVFLGEAPGADEDKQGVPFVGRAGQLLTKIIEACTLSRDDVYILNILKCRPPANRNPSPAESAACRGFLDRQLAAIRPEFICCMGAVAAQNLLDTDTPIGKLRGSFHEYQGIKVLCTYHPAYLLRNPPAKRFVWEDMLLLMAEMGVELPAK